MNGLGLGRFSLPDSAPFQWSFGAGGCVVVIESIGEGVDREEFSLLAHSFSPLDIDNFQAVMGSTSIEALQTELTSNFLDEPGLTLSKINKFASSKLLVNANIQIRFSG